MKGHVAQRYGELVKELWSGQTRSLAPLKLRVRLLEYTRGEGKLYNWHLYLQENYKYN